MTCGFQSIHIYVERIAIPRNCFCRNAVLILIRPLLDLERIRKSNMRTAGLKCTTNCQNGSRFTAHLTTSSAPPPVPLPVSAAGPPPFAARQIPASEPHDPHSSAHPAAGLTWPCPCLSPRANGSRHSAVATLL